MRLTFMMEDGCEDRSEGPTRGSASAPRNSRPFRDKRRIPRSPEVRKVGGDNRRRAGGHQRYIATQTVCEAAHDINTSI